MKSAKIFTFFLLSVLFVFTEQAASKKKVVEPLRDGYYYEQAVIVREFNEQDKLRECDIVRLYEPGKFNELLKNLTKALEKEVKPISYEQFNLLKKECDALDDQIDSKKPKPKETTKWCGYEGPAESYHDLGSDRITDRCCRDHAVCPIRIAGEDTRYGLTNKSPLARSHCLCEREFYNCLVGKTLMGNLLATTYFLQIPDCIEGIPNKDPMSFEKTILM